MEEQNNEMDKVIEGVILDIDFGYGMKYTDTENLFLKLEVQQFDGHTGVQLFSQEKIGKLLLQFKGDYRGEISIRHLRHCRIFLSGKSTNGVPDAIAKMPPNKYPQYSWVYNDNWN